MPPSSTARPDAATPERRALLVLLLYLALLLVVIVATGVAARRPMLVVAHVLSIVMLATLALHVERGLPVRVAVWIPVVALPLSYAELGAIFDASARVAFDPLVLGWEGRLFGEPARTFASQAPWRALSELLHAGYLSYYLLIGLPLLILSLRGASRRDALGETALALTLAYTSCFLIFALFPVEGPRYRFGASPGAPPGLFRDVARALLHEGSSRGTAFPSSHVAVALAVTLAALRHQRAVGIAAASCTVLIALGAVYGGFHYAVDVVAGGAVGALAWVAARRLSRDDRGASRGDGRARGSAGGDFSLPPAPGARDTSRTPR